MKIIAKFQNIIDLVSNVMEAHTTAFFVSGGDGKFVELYCHQSFSKTIKKSCKINKGEGIIGWVFKEQKKMIAANFERSSKNLGFYGKEVDIKSMMALHLPKNRGVLYVDSKRSYALTEEKEKIFAQMVSLLYLLMREQEEIEDNYILTKLLEVNLMIDIKRYKFTEINEIFKEVSRCLELKYLIFFGTEKLPIYLCKYDEIEDIYIFSEKEREYYSPDGLIGWSLKSSKMVLKNREINSDKTFVLNKEDGIKIDNICAFPLKRQETGKREKIMAVIALSKRKETSQQSMKKREFWNRKEINILEAISFKLLKIIEKNSDVL